MPLPTPLPTLWFPYHIADFAGAATATKPDDSTLGHGYDPDAVLTAENLTWLLQAFAGIGAHTPLVFASPDDAILYLTYQAASGIIVAGTPTYIPCVVDEYDGNHAPGTIHTDTDVGHPVTSVGVSGAAVVYCSSGQLIGHAVGRDTTTAIASYDLAGAATFDVYSRIITDGSRYTICSYGQFVECFTYAGVHVWTYDHGAQVYDIAMDGTRVYLVGAIGTGSHHARALTLVAGAGVWDYRHSAAGSLYAVATNGRQVFVAGTASSYASGATIRALEATTGNDAANEGGTAADTLGLAWDDVQATPIGAWGMTLCTDGPSLFVGYSAAAARQVERRGANDGTILASAEIPTENVLCIAVDQRYLFAAHDGADAVVAFEKQTLSRAWRWLEPAANPINAVASDGFAVFAGCDVAARRLTRLYRGNSSTLCRRCDPADDSLPYRLLLVPQE